MSKDADESTGASGRESGGGSRLGRGTEGLGFWGSREKKAQQKGRERFSQEHLSLLLQEQELWVMRNSTERLCRRVPRRGAGP